MMPVVNTTMPSLQQQQQQQQQQQTLKNVWKTMKIERISTHRGRDAIFKLFSLRKLLQLCPLSNFDGLNAHKNKEQRYLKLVISIQKKKKQFHLKK